MQKSSGDFESMKTPKGPKNSYTWLQKNPKTGKIVSILI